MQIAKKNPEIIQPLARKEVSWPLMMSRQPGYSVKHIEYLVSLQQGDDANYDINQTSRTGTQRKAVEKGTREVAQSLYCCLLAEWKRTQQKLDGKPVAQFCDNEAVLSVWWKVAVARLLEAYPKPHEIPELSRIAAPSRTAPSHIRDDMLKRLKAAFIGLAKNQSELEKAAKAHAV